jgi:hypothetical protein
VVTVKTPVRVPLVVGLKITDTMQLLVAARLTPHVLVCEKSPLATIDPIAAATVALFVIVIPCAAEFTPITPAANVSEFGEMVASAGATPVPVTVLLNAPLGTFVAKVTVPVRAPVAVGVNTTFALQLELIATVAQFVETAKSPVAVTPLTTIGPSPVLLNVKTCPELEAPSTTLPNDAFAVINEPASTGAGRLKYPTAASWSDVRAGVVGSL